VSGLQKNCFVSSCLLTVACYENFLNKQIASDFGLMIVALMISPLVNEHDT